MKSKITLIILLVVILFLAALSFFFGVNYFQSKGKIDELNEQVLAYTNEIEELKNQEPVTETKMVMPKFDPNKVDASQRENVYVSAEEYGSNKQAITGFTYREGPRKNLSTISIESDATSQMTIYGKDYNISDKNIVDLKIQNRDTSSGWYIIALLDDGTIKYAAHDYKVSQSGASLEFKNYSLTDVVGLVQLQMKTTSGKNIQCVGAITSDGVTHLLPYEMP